MTSGKIKQEILNSIEIMIDVKLKKLSFDQTYKCIIVKEKRVSVDAYKYTIKIGQNDYEIQSKTKYKVGDKVYVRVPCNNWSNIYIDKLADK